MPKHKKPKCVIFLTEGPSDRKALNSFFTDLYSMIDEDIEVFFPPFRESSLSPSEGVETNFNGDITARNGITPENILPMLLKLFIHPLFRKEPAYEYPSSVYEVIHLVDIDGAYINDDKVLTAEVTDSRKLPYYDDVSETIIAGKAENIQHRNRRKRDNLEKLISTKRLNITMEKGKNETRAKPYRVFYFSSNLDHVLFSDANNADKVSMATHFGNDFYGEPLKMARYFLEHPCAIKGKTYSESWDFIKEDNHSIHPYTNINILVEDLLSKAGVPVNELPENNIYPYDQSLNEEA